MNRLIILQNKIRNHIMMKNLLQNKIDKLYSISELLLENLENHYARNVIDKISYKHYLKKMISFIDELKKIPRNLSIIKMLSTPSIQSDLIESMDSLDECIHSIGIADINMLLNHYNVMINAENQEFIKVLCKYFIPTSTRYDILDTMDEISLNEYSGSTVIMKTHGAELWIKNYSKSTELSLTTDLVIRGYFKADPGNLYLTIDWVNDLIIQMNPIHYYINNDSEDHQFNIFYKKYLDQMSVKEILIHGSEKLTEIIWEKYKTLKGLTEKNLPQLIMDFILERSNKQREIILLFLLSGESHEYLAYVLYDVLKKDYPERVNDIYNSLHWNLKKEFNDSTSIIRKKNKPFKIESIPYDKRIEIMPTSDAVKAKAMEKYKAMESNDNKAQQYLDGLLSIPFGNYRSNPIVTKFKKLVDSIESKNPKATSLKTHADVHDYIHTQDSSFLDEWNSFLVAKKEYLDNGQKSLNSAVYGHEECKREILRLMGQWVNSESQGAIIGIQGPPGNGKTTIIKEGLSKCLIDQEGVRPFAFLPIGGSTNGSTLVGHNYTYVGSTWGRIVDILIQAKCMNPIIFIDEVDKISRTEHGKEIAGILTHLTDPSQNAEFEDKYFSNIPLDLSRATIVFSFNDESLLDPILKDRMTIIRTKALTLNEKTTIVNQYMLPSIVTTVGIRLQDIKITEATIQHIVNTYTYEAGVRKLKEKFFEIIREINLKMIQNNESLPVEINVEMVEELFVKKLKNVPQKIHNDPTVGVVNGLYATSIGQGGITPIQTKRIKGKDLNVIMTGSMGKVMKESIECARTNAWNLCSEETKNKLKENPFDVHIHAPDGATPKDGPSAGAALTLAIYSQFNEKKIDNQIAMTGEIDLMGKVGKIGGLYSKLMGAKNAGITKVLISQENFPDLELLRKEKKSFESNEFKIIIVENIHQVLENSLV